jgi:hypothetical protein
MAKLRDDQLAAVVDGNGKIQAQFMTDGAKSEAEHWLSGCQKGGVQHLSGASVVTGQQAKKAMENGRI